VGGTCHKLNFLIYLIDFNLSQVNLSNFLIGDLLHCFCFSLVVPLLSQKNYASIKNGNSNKNASMGIKFKLAPTVEYREGKKKISIAF